MRNNHLLQGLVGTGLTLALLGWNSAATAGLKIEPIWGTGLTGTSAHVLAVQARVNHTLQLFEAAISTPITVKIEISAPPICPPMHHIDCMDSFALGESMSVWESVPYSQYRDQLKRQATSANDHLANHYLDSNPLVPCASTDSAGDCLNNPVDGSTEIWITRANARALGLTGSCLDECTLPSDVHGTIALAVHMLNIDRDPTAPDFDSKYDLVGDLSHELNELLGLGSGLRGSRPTTAHAWAPASDLHAMAQDLFRYSAPNTRSYSVLPTATAYFSTDGGNESLVKFNQNPDSHVETRVGDFGDWYSCYESSHANYVQNACGTPGAPDALMDPGGQTGGLAWTNLDVQGWTFTNPTQDLGYHAAPVANRTTPSGRATGAKTRISFRDLQCRLRIIRQNLRNGVTYLGNFPQCDSRLTSRFDRVERSHGVHPEYGPASWHAQENTDTVEAHVELLTTTSSNPNAHCSAALARAFASHIRCENKAARKESKGRDPRRTRARCDAHIERRVDHLDLKYGGEASCTAGIEVSELIAASRGQ